MEEFERGSPLQSTIRLDSDEQLHTRVAWYYFVGHLTQQQIADRLGTSRARVNRLLAECRARGLVQLTIRGELSECVSLREKLTARYGLAEAIVVPAPDNIGEVRDVVGAGAGAYLSRIVGDNTNLAVGWGRTLRATLRASRRRSLANSSVVSLQGGLAHCSGTNTFKITSGFADLYDADRHFFPAPIFASDEYARDVLLEQDAIRETCDKALAADLALITVGEMTQSLVTTYGLDTSADRDALIAAGAVGDVIGHFIDAAGQLVDHPVNRRTIAIALEDLRRIDRVVLVAGGADRVAIIRAALLAALVDVVVTDEVTAAALLD